ncbi:unnamed protein product [Malus baccata var. baccata]
MVRFSADDTGSRACQITGFKWKHTCFTLINSNCDAKRMIILQAMPRCICGQILVCNQMVLCGQWKDRSKVFSFRGAQTGFVSVKYLISYNSKPKMFLTTDVGVIENQACHFVGSPYKSKGYRFYAPNVSDRIFESNSSKFIENGEVSSSSHTLPSFDFEKQINSVRVHEDQSYEGSMELQQPSVDFQHENLNNQVEITEINANGASLNSSVGPMNIASSSQVPARF